MRTEFIRICRRAVERGLQFSSGGNISARLDDGRFLAKPTGISLADLTEEDLLIVDAAGNVLEGAGKPSKELPTHFTVYATLPTVKAITHYHPPHATAFAVSGAPPDLLTVHARRILGVLPLLPEAGEGSPELGRMIEEAIRRNPALRAVLLAGHGILSWGSCLAESENMAELVEETARICVLSRQIRQERGACHDEL